MSSRRPHTRLTQLLQYLNGDTTGTEAGQFFIVRDGPKHCTLPSWQPKVTFTHFQMPKLVWAGQASECLPTPEPTISAPSVVPVAMISARWPPPQTLPLPLDHGCVPNQQTVNSMTRPNQNIQAESIILTLLGIWMKNYQSDQIGRKTEAARIPQGSIGTSMLMCNLQWKGSRNYG